MDQLRQQLSAMGVQWSEVWRLTVDRRAGEIVVLLGDGRKLRRAYAEKEEEAHTKTARGAKGAKR